MSLAKNIIDALPPQFREALDDHPEAREALAAVLDSAVPVELRALTLRAEAIALQQKAGELLDEADQAEALGPLARAVADAEKHLGTAEADAGRLVASVRELVAAERAAADKFAEAAEYARECQESVDALALAEAPADQQTEAILKRDAAVKVEAKFRQTAEQATAQRVQREAETAGAREVVRQARFALKAAQEAQASPGRAASSWWTLTPDGVRRMASGERLSPSEQSVVADFVEPLCAALGLTAMYRAQGAQKKEEQLEAAGKASLMGKVKPENVQEAQEPQEVSAVFTPPGAPRVAPLLFS